MKQFDPTAATACGDLQSLEHRRRIDAQQARRDQEVGCLLLLVLKARDLLQAFPLALCNDHARHTNLAFEQTDDA